MLLTHKKTWCFKAIQVSRFSYIVAKLSRTNCISLNKRVPRWMLKCLNLIKAHGSFFQLKKSHWQINYTVTTEYVILVRTYHLQVSPLSSLTVKEGFSNSSLTAVKLKCILLWPCCTQAPRIRLGTRVTCSKSTHRYKRRIPPYDSWFDNLGMVMDFIHLICQFCQFYDNSSSKILPADPKCLSSQQGVLVDFVVFCWWLILITIKSSQPAQATIA